MNKKPYGLICPITRACDVLEPRWTIPILSEIWAGSTKFNEIRRGVGSISPALLSKRLKDLEELGMIERVEDPATGAVDYIRTQMAIDLEPALNAMAVWAQKYIEAEIACGANLSSLTWKMRKYIVPEELPQRRVVIRFHFKDDDLDYDTYWIVERSDLGPFYRCARDRSGADVRHGRRAAGADDAALALCDHDYS